MAIARKIEPTRSSPILALALSALAISLCDPGSLAEELAPTGEQAAHYEPTISQCNPMLSLHSIIGDSGQQPATRADQSMSFRISDIKVPISPAHGSLSSALKLISSLDRQFSVAAAADDDDYEQPSMAEEEELEEEELENVVKFRRNKLSIEGLNLNMLNVHLFNNSEPKFAVGINIQNTTLSGRFSYRGPVQLAAFYRMTIDDVYLVASSNLTRSPSDEQQARSAGSLTPQLRTNDFKMNITNLGHINIEIYDTESSPRPSSNYLLRILQRLLQKTIKRTYYTFEGYIRQTLQMAGRKSLDCELTRFTPLLSPVQGDQAQASHQSDLSRILSSELEKSQLGSVQLPDYELRQSFFGSGASILLHNGTLSGLNKLLLFNETRLKLQDNHLSVNTSVGWQELRPRYNWTLVIGQQSASASVAGANKGANGLSSGFVGFTIKQIDFDASISKGTKPHTRFVVQELTIRRLDGLKMDIAGLPGLNRLTRGMVNFFMGRLKQRLVSSLEPVLRGQLEQALNGISLLGGQTRGPTRRPMDS